MKSTSLGTEELNALQNPETNGIAWGLYALPNETETHCFSYSIHANSPVSSGQHFVMQPFFPEGPDPAMHINMANVKVIHSAELHSLFPESGWQSKSKPNILSRETYIAQVRETQKKLSSENPKYMAARVAQFPAPNRPISELWQKLNEEHPNSFRWFISAPFCGTWMGASPEELLIAQGSNARSVSLAGTRKVGQLEWGDKEKEEQALVTAYIEEVYHDSGLMFVNTGERITHRAGTIEHLKTEITGKFFIPDHEAIMNLAMRLHPTPAVGGIGKAMAMQIIKEQEGNNRSYYSGFVGLWNNANPMSKLYVNLRCMQWIGDSVMVYAGAGITALSVPEKEWEETEAKIGALTRIWLS
jgi:isochorismate synthase EntC